MGLYLLLARLSLAVVVPLPPVVVGCLYPFRFRPGSRPRLRSGLHRLLLFHILGPHLGLGLHRLLRCVLPFSSLLLG